MNNSPFHIRTYDKSYEPMLMDLEKEATQGHLIRLKMNRKDFASRSEIFENHRVFLSVSKQDELQGVAAGALIPIEMNGQQFAGGFGYDLRVRQEWRRMGLARKFGEHLIKDYFKPFQAAIYFTTSKKDNVAVYKAALGLQHNWKDISFVYLTIPTGTRFNNFQGRSTKSRFTAGLLSNRMQLANYFEHTGSGIGIWHTHKVYSLQILRIHPIVKTWLWLRNKCSGSSIKLPGTGAEMRFATAFDLTPHNIGSFPEAMKYLSEKGIHFCNVICARDDFKYQALKQYAINSYEYILINAPGFSNHDSVKIDVRCL